MKTAIIAFLFASALAAQNGASPAMYTLGPWPICESTAAPYAGALCAGFTPGHELYLLEIPQPSQSQTVAFRYTVTATLIATGEIVVRSGVVERAENGASQTTATLDFGGPVSRWSIRVDDLGVMTSRLRERP